MRITSFLVTAALVLEASIALAGAPMIPNDIKTTFFNGQPFTAATPSGTKFTMTFTPDGKMTRQPLAQPDKKDVGTWKLNATGFCSSWERKKQNCFTVIPISDNKWSIQQIATTIAVTIAVWSK
jgi:hypothetical protein